MKKENCKPTSTVLFWAVSLGAGGLHAGVARLVTTVLALHPLLLLLLLLLLHPIVIHLAGARDRV